MSRDAVSGNFSAGEGSSGQSLIAPVKYGTLNLGANTLTQLDGESIPCAVCEADQSVNTLVIHGTVTCPRWYNREYAGWTMAPGRDGNRASAVCVHSRAVASEFSGGVSTADYGRVVPVEIESCGFSESGVPDSCAAAGSGLGDKGPDRRSCKGGRRGLRSS